MKRSSKIISWAGIISCALLFFACLSTVASAETNETEVQVSSNSMSLINEDESYWTEEHEGNGPEGSQEMPMERMQASKIFLACGLILVNSSLAWYQFRGGTHDKVKS